MTTKQRRKSGLPPELRPLTTKQMRERMEAAVERLLNAVETLIGDLDALDADPDLEPSCGATAPGLYSDGWDNSRSPLRGYGRQLLDIDDVEHDGREPPDDDEPTLGACEGGGGTNWNTNHMGCWTGESEPSLASLEQIDQRRWTAGDREDHEEQCEDEGGQCDDEGANQGDDEGDAQATCQHFYDEGRRTWPPAVAAS